MKALCWNCNTKAELSPINRVCGPCLDDLQDQALGQTEADYERDMDERAGYTIEEAV